MDQNTKRIYLIKHSALLEPGIKIDKKDEWISFGNMQIKIKDGIDDPNDIKLLTENTLPDALIAEINKDPDRFKGNDGKDGKNFNVHGNADSIAEVIAKPNPQVDDVWIVKGEMIVYNGQKWVNGGQIAIATTNTKWRNVNKEGIPALQTAHGEIVLLEDLSGHAQLSTLDNAAASQGFVTQRTQAKDYKKLVKLDKITLNSATTNGGKISYQEHFGDLDTLVERQNFLAHALIGQWYTFNVGNQGYQALVYAGSADTSYQWVGFKEFTGANGISMEVVKGITTDIGNSTQAAPLVGEFFANTVAQPVSYGALQFLPKDVIVQLINDILTPAIADGSDPTWRDLDGTQATLFNPAQITITLTDSGIVADEDIQLILGSTAGDLVLDETIHVYPNVVEASQNGYVSGTYKWYMYLDGANVKFVMEDSSGSLTDTTQTLTKIRRVAPRVQVMEGHYTPQTEVLKSSFNISGVNKGASTEWTLPASMTIDNLTQISLTVSGSTTWTTISGWDRVTPFYISSSTKDASNEWWVQYKVEAVPGDRTKLKLTNFNSGNFGTDSGTYNGHWVSVKGGL